jgi:hypothetical protein
MRMNDMFPSKYLKKEEFPEPKILTIKLCAIEDVAKGEAKPILYFNELTKGLVLNKTKGSLLSETFGDESDTWTGRKVKLSADMSVRDLAGKIVGGIKLECSKAKPSAKPAPVTVAEIEPDDSDDIPF